MNEVKKNEYWRLIDDFYEKSPDSEQLISFKIYKCFIIKNNQVGVPLNLLMNL
jgi:hypothetical protein